jgi:type II secretory pathway pseudopilin PulG
MNKVNNERGATLLISLLLILLVVILTTSLATLAVTSLKQAQMTEDNLELTNLAEMGIEYYHKQINSFIANDESKTYEEFHKAFDNKFKGIKEVNIDDVDGVHSFKVEIAEISKELNEEEGEEKLIIIIRSIGIKNSNQESKEIVSLLSYKNLKFKSQEELPSVEKVAPINKDSFPNSEIKTKSIGYGESVSFNEDKLMKTIGNKFEMESFSSFEIDGDAVFRDVAKDIIFRGTVNFGKDDKSIVYMDHGGEDKNDKDKKGIFKIFENIVAETSKKKDDDEADDIDTTKLTSVDFKGDFYGNINSINQDANTKWTIGRNAYFDVETEMIINGTLTIIKDAYFKKNSSSIFNVGPSGEIIINEYADFKNISFNTETANIQGYIHIQKGAIFHQDDLDILGETIIVIDTLPEKKLPNKIEDRKGKIFVKEAFFIDDKNSIVNADGFIWEKEDISKILYDNYENIKDQVNEILQ